MSPLNDDWKGIAAHFATGPGYYAPILKAMNKRLRKKRKAKHMTEEMENYRMALAYISKQSTDPQSRELAETALNAFPANGEPQRSQGLTEAVSNYFKLWDRCGGSEAIAADLFATARQNMRAALSDTRPDREGK